MKRISSFHPSTERPAYPLLANGNVEAAEASATGQKKTFVHLLKNHTLEGIAKLLLDDPRPEYLYLGKFLLDGKLPDDRWLTNLMAEWLLNHREPDVFLALLDLGPIAVNLLNEPSAATLLQIVQARQQIDGLEIKIGTGVPRLFEGRVLTLLIDAIKIGNGPGTWSIAGHDYRRHGLAPLLDALGSVRNLELVTPGSELAMDDYLLLADLATKNRHIKLLDLNFRLRDLGQGACPFSGPMNDLLTALKGQSGLEQLGLSGVPQASQRLLGEFIGESRAITGLNISLYGHDATEPLIAGLRQNTTLAQLTLEVDKIEDGMLPLITLLSENKCGPAQFLLETRNGRNDTNDSRLIADMIARNVTISDFSWHFRDHHQVDLNLIGLALERNRTLDTIALSKTDQLPGEEDVFESWIHQGQLPGLVARLRNNRTLTKFNFCDHHWPTMVRPTHPEIELILERNLSYQRYACSTGFMEGAARGLFAALDLPAELGQPTVPYLLQQKPRIQAASLALVNKTTYASALDGRRYENAEMMKQTLLAADRNNGDAADQMVDLLKRIVVTPQDFSEDALREIACSPLMLDGLFTILESSRPDYETLVARFSDASGFLLIQMLIGLENQARQNPGRNG